MSELHLFIDETGNLDFAQTGTSHFALSILCTTEPENVRIPLQQLKDELINGEHPISLGSHGFFHASQDKQALRNLVFDRIASAECFHVDSVIARKRNVTPYLQAHEDIFYFRLGKAAINYACNRAAWRGYSKVHVNFGALFKRKKQARLREAFTAVLNETKMPYELNFMASQDDLCNQVVDYVAWAIFRKYEINDERSFKLIQRKVTSLFDIY